MGSGSSGFEPFGQSLATNETTLTQTTFCLSKDCTRKIEFNIEHYPKIINPTMLFGHVLPNNVFQITDILSTEQPLRTLLAHPPHEQMFEDMQRWCNGARYVMREKFALRQIGWWLHNEVLDESWIDLKEYEIGYFLDHPWFSIDFDAVVSAPPRFILKTTKRENAIQKVGYALDRSQNKYNKIVVSE